MGHAPWTLEDTKARARLSLRDSFPVLFGDAWIMARDIYLSTFEAIHLARLRPLPGAEVFLALLAERGTCVAIVSNKTGRLLRDEVAALGWSRFFHKVVGAGDTEADKPHRAPIDTALEGSGIVAGPAVWYVGDNELDIATARAADCTAVLIHGESKDTGPDLAVADFAALIATFRTLRHLKRPMP